MTHIIKRQVRLIISRCQNYTKMSLTVIMTKITKTAAKIILNINVQNRKYMDNIKSHSYFSFNW